LTKSFAVANQSFCPAGDDGGSCLRAFGSLSFSRIAELETPSSMLHARSLESAPPGRGDRTDVRAAQQEWEAIARSVFGEIFFRYGSVPPDPVGNDIFQTPPQVSIEPRSCLANLFVRRNGGL